MSQQIPFKLFTKYGIFSDVLLIPEDATYSEEEIETMKKQRLFAWVYAINSVAVKVDGIEALGFAQDISFESQDQ